MDSSQNTPFTVPETLPYRHLNLCRNPFGVPHERDRPELAIADVCHWADQLQTKRVAIQLIGDHGRGKSSHLFALKKELETRTNTHVPYIRLRDTHRIPAAPIVLLDEGAHLPIRPWWRLRHIRSLAISTHRNMRPLLMAFGFNVTTIQIQQRDPQRLHEIFSRRIEWARAGMGPIPVLQPQTVHQLQAKYGDDIRTMEDALYNSIEHMSEVGHVRLLD